MFSPIMNDLEPRERLTALEEQVDLLGRYL